MADTVESWHCSYSVEATWVGTVDKSIKRRKTMQVRAGKFFLMISDSERRRQWHEISPQCT